MDDTVAMQDTNGPTLQAPVSKADVSDNSIMPSTEQLAGAAADSSRPDFNPCAPQSPPTGLQQVHFDASSVASDGSQDQAGSSTSSKQHGPPRRTYSSVDVDAAKQAAMSALAGLDMTTTKANLDASKQAAATARANGEVPAHVRKSNLRSVSCRQLGSSSTTGGVGKSVAFDEASKQRPADGPARTVQWRAGTTSTAVDGTQPCRTTRAPASRCISLPHVLQGRAGMANRLAATYAQEAALQQQLQLLNGSTQAGHQFAGGVNQLQAGVPNMDVLSMYQLQQQAAAGGLQNGQLISQRSFGANQVATMDDSVLQLRSQNALLAAQQQQQQQQAARLAGNWPNAAAQQQRVSWAPGTAQVPQQQATLANQQQLLLQLQGGTQAMPAAGAGGNEALWLQNPAAASAALMGASRPQNLLLANQAGGIPGLAASSALLSPHLQQGAGAAGLAANPQTSAMVAAFTQLLEQYQNVSWTVLAAAQADSNVREQLLTEVVLQLTLLHTLSGVLKSTLAPGDALSDFSYLGSAARRHIATFSRLSQAGDLAVQLLAMLAPLACRHLTSTDVMEAAFLVLDTLALSNRDVAAVVAQQRINALGNLLVQLPMDQLLQQQTLGLAWINSMAAAVNRNKQVLESIAGGDQAGVGQPAVSAAILQGGNAGLPLSGMPLSSQPLMVSPTGPTLSPTGKTPLATYFEEQNPATGMVSPSGAAGTGGAPGLGGVPGLTAAVPADVLLQDGLAGFTLNGQAGATADDAAAGLASLQLGVAPGLAPTGAGAGAAGGTGRTYSPLGAGLPLFGDASLLVPSSAAGQNGPSSGGVAAGIVGV